MIETIERTLTLEHGDLRLIRRTRDDGERRYWIENRNRISGLALAESGLAELRVLLAMEHGA